MLYVPHCLPSIVRSFTFPLQIIEELEDCLGNCMEEVLGLVRSSLTAPPPSSSPVTAVEAELALPMQLPLEIVDETPTGAHDGNEGEYIDAGEGVGIEGDLDVEDDE